MDIKEVNLEEVHNALLNFVAGYGEVGKNFKAPQEAADALGVNRVFLWKMIEGQKPISASVLEKLGFERTTTVTNEYARKQS